MQASPWRWATAQQNSPVRGPYLNHSASLVSLHDSNWSSWKYDAPSSPTESSSSSASDILTPTASTFDQSESRNSTPTPSTPPQLFSAVTYSSFASKNPWRNMNHQSYSPPVSPKSSPHSNSPQNHSRASTPVASMSGPISPQPIRPALIHAATDPAAYEAGAARSRPSPPPLTSPTPLSFNDIENDKLPVQPITQELVSHVVKVIPRIITKYGWKRENANWVYQWAIQQPKTALLLWMCEDLQAWKRAMLYGLKDSAMPFEEDHLEGIATNPARVIKLQWNVAMKSLPRDGQHVEFQTQEHVPLKEVGPLTRTDSSTKTLAKVRYLDAPDSQLYVRKRFEISADRPQDKKTLLDQIKQFNRLEHDNLAKIMSSYARGSVVAFVTPYAQYNLEQYLAAVDDYSHSELILGWTTDICSALGYLHQKRLEHRNVRPQKLLIDTAFNRIYFSVFGISLPARSSSYSYLYRQYSEEPAYVYAAPEVLSRRDIRQRETRQAADVFSLGCCLLDMLSVVKGQSIAKTTTYRSALSHDLSFHANLERVHTWIKHLASVKVSVAASRRNFRSPSPNRMLKIVQFMLNSEPEGRPAMKHILREIDGAYGHTADRRRNSDVVTGGIGSIMASAPRSPPRNQDSRFQRVTPPRADFTSTPTPRNSSPPSRQDAPFSRTPPRTEFARASPSASSTARNSPPRQQQTQPEYSMRTPPRSDFPRESNIWDLQTLSGYYRTPAAPAAALEYRNMMASVYDD